MVFLSIDKSTNESKNESTNESKNESTNESTNESKNESTNESKNESKNEKLTDKLSNYIRNGKSVFILIYMNHCGPCNETRPEWKKLENVFKKYKDSEDIIIVDIEHELLDEVKENNISPAGFPTIKYISDGGKVIKNYDNFDTKDKKRTVDSFVEWINYELKNNNNNQQGGKKLKTKNKSKKNKSKKNKSKNNKSKNNKKHKWSMKYKKSINCKRPKGFSQKQFCKYNKINKNK